MSADWSPEDETDSAQSVSISSLASVFISVFSTISYVYVFTGVVTLSLMCEGQKQYIDRTLNLGLSPQVRLWQFIWKIFSFYSDINEINYHK